MAKVTFTKLGLNKLTNDNKTTIEFNNQSIEVLTFLPYKQKVELVQQIVNDVIGESKFLNPCQFDLFSQLDIVFAYTNINFTDKQKEDLFKLHDQLSQSGLLTKIYAAIPDSEISNILGSATKAIHNYFKYRNSAVGIMEIISSDYSNLEMDATKIQSALNDENNMSLLRNVLEKLG